MPHLVKLIGIKLSAAMSKCAVAFFLVLVCFVALVHGQDQSGFISIDCGLPVNSTYIDVITGISYVSDVEYLNSENGVSGTISSSYITVGLDQQLIRSRSFTRGLKNCYTIKPSRLEGRGRYFVRARFLYGNYDGKKLPPTFDLYFGVDYWTTVNFSSFLRIIDKEILHVPSETSDFIYVCLVNTGMGTPFISALELRLVDDGIYTATSGSLQLFGRYDLRSYDKLYIIRYNDDVFDRIWESSFMNAGVTELNTTATNIPSVFKDDDYKIPLIVMQTAITSKNQSEPIRFYWKPSDPTTGFYICIHFADFQSSLTRQFDITLNDGHWGSNYKPSYLSTTSACSKKPETPAPWFNFTLIKTTNSELPPIMNAIEVYTAVKFSYQLTSKADVKAINSIKATYGLKKDWQGDPCLPVNYSWESIGCFNTTPTDDPRIISLNLSSNGLTGNISSLIANLKVLETLDLSNNKLTGPVPDFLVDMQSLKVLILSNNNLSGIIPAILMQKSKHILLKLSVEGNTNLCISEPCVIIPTPPPMTNKKRSKILIYIVAAAVGVFIILIVVGMAWIIFVKKRNLSKQQGKKIYFGMKMKGRLMHTDNRQFTYSEILSITNKLETIIGKGGFGPVYHGYLEGTEVAVKMLSSSSRQGYKEFRAEIDFLTRVHHVNLTTLIGYCDENDNIGLIYEYMANGNLKEHLSDKQPIVMSWEERLRIAMDAATGLEYLHHGCKPPIIHRDVKSDNILLDQKFQAKLADFGLSKDFPVEDTHVSTAVAGTPGYLDPEYYISYQLTEKSDIYSFGVVLLEIITGKPVLIRDQKNAHIIQRISFMLNNEEDVTHVIDPRLGGDFEMNSLIKVLDVAMACASPTSALRPSMNRVVMELNHCLALEMTRINNCVLTEIKEESRKGDGVVSAIKVAVSVNFDSENSLSGR